MSGVEVDTRELDRELRGIERRVTDYSPVTPVIAEILVGFVNDEWESAGRGRWPGLAPSTLRKRRGTSAQILKDTGRAAGSVRGEYDHESASAVTDVAYMIYHASEDARTVLPLRNPFDVEDVAMPEIEDVLVDFIAGDIL
jgi:phage gpG-like protein